MPSTPANMRFRGLSPSPIMPTAALTQIVMKAAKSAAAAPPK
jgi:hypothetical protein